MTEFESFIRELTRPINGQYPRPWMTSTHDPEHARVFVIGRNQATPIPEAAVGNHTGYLDSLFNRNGRSCRVLYDQVRAMAGKDASPTRGNLDALTAELKKEGISDVLETNVICYSTPMSADLTRAEHRGGSRRGTEIFLALLNAVRPQILIAHGSGTHKELGRLLGSPIPPPPGSAADGVRQARVRTQLESGPSEATVIALRSLAPPAYNRWASWAPEHLRDVAAAVAAQLRST